MTDFQIFVGVASAGAILLIVLGVAWNQGPDRVQTRLDQLSPGGPRNVEEIELQQPLIDRLLDPVATRLSSVGGRIISQGSTARVGRQLGLAGIAGQVSPASWVAIRLVAAFVVGSSVFLLLALIK